MTWNANITMLKKFNYLNEWVTIIIFQAKTTTHMCLWWRRTCLLTNGITMANRCFYDLSCWVVSLWRILFYLLRNHFIVPYLVSWCHFIYSYVASQWEIIYKIHLPLNSLIRRVLATVSYYDTGIFSFFSSTKVPHHLHADLAVHGTCYDTCTRGDLLWI